MMQKRNLIKKYTEVIDARIAEERLPLIVEVEEYGALSLDNFPMIICKNQRITRRNVKKTFDAVKHLIDKIIVAKK